jgi:3-hydroxyisobutyrate dehydrogenase
MTTKVAVLGAGRMGGAIARRLASGGFEVTVWDRNQGKASALGVGRVAGSPAEAVLRADVAISMVTGPQAVREIYFGDGGVFAIEGARTVVEMSTAGAEVARELAREAAARGITFIDAPVMGSVPAVESGTLIVLASAERASDLITAQPVLERLGEVRYVGKPGTSAMLKLIANSMLAVISAEAAELMAAGSARGLDPEQIFWVLSRLAPGLRVREAGFVRHVHEPAMFAVRDLLKDLELGLALYAGSSVPFTALARGRFASVAAQTPDLDISAVAGR